MSHTTFEKPEPRDRTKRRARRKEGAVKKSIRAQCVERDGDCRLGEWENNPDDWHADALEGSWCEGPSEWAHLGDKKRARTRGQAPEVRHTTAGSLMLCRTHHQQHDAGTLAIDGDSADGVLGFRPATEAES